MVRQSKENALEDLRMLHVVKCCVDSVIAKEARAAYKKFEAILTAYAKGEDSKDPVTTRTGLAARLAAVGATRKYIGPAGKN